jgi:flagellar biosynthetic protein FliQ
MTQEFVIGVCTQAIYLVLVLTAPILFVTLLLGVLVGIFQAVTSIQEMTLTFIPKILVAVLVLIITFPWMLNKVMDFTRLIFSYISSVGR